MALLVRRRRKAISSEGERGFVLLSVLLVTTVIAAMALATLIRVRSYNLSSSVEARLIEAQSLADAGLVRMIAALQNPDDALIPALHKTRHPLVWIYAGQEIELSLSMEAGKVDLNTGDSALVRSVLRGIIGDAPRAADIVERWEEGRRSGQVFETVSAVMPVHERFGPDAQRLGAAFTTVSGAQGIDPLAAPDFVLLHVPGLTDADRAVIAQAREGNAPADMRALRARLRPLLDGQRPLYRLQASLSWPEGIQVRRVALVAQNLGTRTIEVTEWRSE